MGPCDSQGPMLSRHLFNIENYSSIGIAAGDLDTTDDEREKLSGRKTHKSRVERKKSARSKAGSDSETDNNKLERSLR